MKNKIIKIWDDFIYGQAFHTIRRMAARTPSFTYLMELQLRKWNKEHPISEELKLITQGFFDAMEDHLDKNKN